jgi:hypothetical protein
VVQISVDHRHDLLLVVFDLAVQVVVFVRAVLRVDAVQIPRVVRAVPRGDAGQIPRVVKAQASRVVPSDHAADLEEAAEVPRDAQVPVVQHAEQAELCVVLVVQHEERVPLEQAQHEVPGKRGEPVQQHAVLGQNVEHQAAVVAPWPVSHKRQPKPELIETFSCSSVLLFDPKLNDRFAFACCCEGREIRFAIL